MRLFCILVMYRHLFASLLNPCVYSGPGVYMSPAFVQMNTVIM